MLFENQVNNRLKALEIYFSRTLGITLLTLAIQSIILTGFIPLSSRLNDPVSTDSGDPKAPYAVPTLTVTMIYHASLAFYCYAVWTQTSVSGFLLGIIGSSILGAMGLWCVLFGSSNGRISRRTGADKRTSGWPFKNEVADKKKGKKF